MSTIIRPETSEKNPYWIPKHRYYELKHFCLQYPTWKRNRAYLSDLISNDICRLKSVPCLSNPTEDAAIRLLYFRNMIDMVDSTARETDPELASYIVTAVTDGYSYDHMRTVMSIPCCKDVFYANYRKFFWLLDKKR